MNKKLSWVTLLVIGNVTAVLSRTIFQGMILELTALITLIAGYHQLLSEKETKKWVAILGSIGLWIINAFIIGIILSFL